MRIFWVLLFSSSIATAEPVGDVRLAPGDFKGGYDKLDYETDSLSLPARTGIDAVKGFGEVRRQFRSPAPAAVCRVPGAHVQGARCPRARSRVPGCLMPGV